VTEKLPPRRGDLARITFGTHRGKSGRINWISRGRTQWDRLYGVLIDGKTLGFARGEFRLVRNGR
jgi:ribosomal protein S4E